MCGASPPEVDLDYIKREARAPAQAELLHHAHRIPAHPLGDELAAANLPDAYPWDREGLARRRHAHELALMRPAHCQSGDDLVPFGNLLVDRGGEVRKCRAETGDQVLEAGDALRSGFDDAPHHCELGMADGAYFIEATHVAVAHDLAEPTLDYGLVFFRAHPHPPMATHSQRTRRSFPRALDRPTGRSIPRPRRRSTRG